MEQFDSELLLMKPLHDLSDFSILEHHRLRGASYVLRALGFRV